MAEEVDLDPMNTMIKPRAKLRENKKSADDKYDKFLVNQKPQKSKPNTDECMFVQEEPQAAVKPVEKKRLAKIIEEPSTPSAGDIEAIVIKILKEKERVEGSKAGKGPSAGEAGVQPDTVDYTKLEQKTKPKTVKTKPIKVEKSDSSEDEFSSPQESTKPSRYGKLNQEKLAIMIRNAPINNPPPKEVEQLNKNEQPQKPSRYSNTDNRRRAR